MTRDELLTDVEWDVLGGDQIEAAQIAAANNRAPVKPAPESTERLFEPPSPRFGPLSAIAEKFGRAG